jgi:mevalonate kinase
MPQSVERTACAKIILCGEHSVVYGRPAIALPLPHLRTRARVQPEARPFRILAPDVDRQYDLVTTPAHPLAQLARLTFERLGSEPPRATLVVTSAIPVASHLGSSASVAVACARAMAAFLGGDLPPAEVSALAFEAEKLFHGSPSGIDNTVIAYEQAVWFVRTQSTEHRAQIAQHSLLTPHSSLLPLVVADTGIATPTKIPVGDVRRGWEMDPARFEALFDEIAAGVVEARAALQGGDWAQLGRLMNRNHELLQRLGVSCAELDGLCEAARRAGALGAKLSGGGRGGNMIALARDDGHAAQLRQALLDAGAKRVM